MPEKAWDTRMASLFPADLPGQHLSWPPSAERLGREAETSTAHAPPPPSMQPWPRIASPLHNEAKSLIENISKPPRNTALGMLFLEETCSKEQEGPSSQSPSSEAGVRGQ